MTVEHLQFLLDQKDVKLFCQVGNLGIVAGDVVRCLVARTMSQQLMEGVERTVRTIVPFLFTLGKFLFAYVDDTKICHQHTRTCTRFSRTHFVCCRNPHSQL